MEAIAFVKSIRERVIESDHTDYQNMLTNTDDATDPTWKEILSLFKNLTKEQKESFLNFLRLIQVNTVSHIFGILDGSTYLDESRETFVLKTESSEDAINGDLQDLFLEMEEE